MNSWKVPAGIAVVALLALVGLVAVMVFVSPSGPQGATWATPGSMWGHPGEMMGGYSGMGPGMMGPGFGAFGQGNELSMEDSRMAVESYLARLGHSDLMVKEVMVFANHSYAQVVEASTGIGAFEVLVDPVTHAVAPEPGPNMMWNLKYGHMSGARSPGTMMGLYGGYGMRGFMGPGQIPNIPAEMPVGPEEAIQAARRYLNAYSPGTDIAAEADPFYGYYTIHVMRNEKTVGMLSVNGYSLQVWPHFWHGELVAMTGGENSP